MTQTDNMAAADNQQDLAKLKLPELRKMASGMGLRGISGLRKGELITAIKTGAVPARAAKEQAPAKETPDPAVAEGTAQAQARTAPADTQQDTQQDKPAAEKTSANDNQDNRDNRDQSGSGDGEHRYESRSAARRARRNRARHGHRDQHNEQQDGQGNQSEQRDDSRQDSRSEGDSGDGKSNQGGQDRQDRSRDNRRDQHHNDGGSNSRRGRRNRRNRRGRDRDRDQHHNDGQNQNNDQDELQEVAGILDVVDNNAAFVRTTGYHTSPADVYINNNLIRRFNLRSGDAITGQVKMGGGGQSHGNGRNRRKYNPLVRVDTVNGMHPEEAKKRPEFHKLTPLYPNQRLRLETEQNILTTRVIDLVMPIGKGQRALIVSPPKAGKTTILQNIANAIATNNPECYMMVVLVDERPEEVTDMQRSVRGEVIASTFDRPPSDHTIVAELAIERAKRLVEQGQDVVVLLDSITRLGRAYNNSSPASGRILSGGVDSNALYPPKRFLGAARNIENGGSLTIIATAMVETGSAGDTVIFEEFKGTGNAELKLDRKISERRVFPAVDVNPSGTRKDDLLLAPDEARVMHKLRRILSALDPQSAIDLLIKQLKKTKNNREFLMQVASSAPMAADVDVDEML